MDRQARTGDTVLVKGRRGQSPNFLTFKEPKNQFQGTIFARLCSLAGRYDNPIPTRFLAPIDCFKSPAQVRAKHCRGGGERMGKDDRNQNTLAPSLGSIVTYTILKCCDDGLS